MPVSAKDFKCDDSILDPAIKAHIASLYRAVDEKDLDVWANHFTEDAIMKKGTTNVQGRAALLDLIIKSWSVVQSRDHIVYAVFPFGPKAEEVMLHGRSHNVDLQGKPATFTWAARMHFERDSEGKVLIDRYIIIVDPHEATLAM
ncbi:hypothetical protein GGR57DRAFT_334453 [Xylariaceae sp. FL1272]|nr:hypothetical protein GGR57DRAFT_334453 [Xylariaceae sp. FL1272]